MRVWSFTLQEHNYSIRDDRMLRKHSESRAKYYDAIQFFQNSTDISNASGWHKACSPCVNAARPWSAVAWLQVLGCSM